MARYFFDYRSHHTVSTDDEGLELPDADAAHEEAVDALTDAIRDVVIEGAAADFAVEVRDELGPVLEVVAILRSKIIRTQ